MSDASDSVRRVTEAGRRHRDFLGGAGRSPDGAMSDLSFIVEGWVAQQCKVPFSMRSQARDEHLDLSGRILAVINPFLERLVAHENPWADGCASGETSRLALLPGTWTEAETDVLLASLTKRGLTGERRSADTNGERTLGRGSAEARYTVWVVDPVLLTIP